MADTIGSIVTSVRDLAKRVRKLETRSAGGSGGGASTAAESIHDGRINTDETIVVPTDHTYIPGAKLMLDGDLVIEEGGAMNLLGTGNPNALVFGITVGSGLFVPPTGICDCFKMPVACKIVGWYIASPKESGSVVIDLWKCSYADLPATVTDSITASAKPTLSGAQKAFSDTLTGWDTTIKESDFLTFKIDSISNTTLFTLSLVAIR